MSLSKIFIASMLLILSVAASADPLRFDGNFWRTLDSERQFMYMVGLNDGLAIQRNNTFMSLLESGLKPEDASKQLNVTNSRSAYLLKNTNTRQIMEGLTAFYADFKNRSIKIQNAVPIVCMQIQGENKMLVDAELDFWRSVKD